MSSSPSSATTTRPAKVSSISDVTWRSKTGGGRSRTSTSCSAPIRVRQRRPPRRSRCGARPRAAAARGSPRGRAPCACSGVGSMAASCTSSLRAAPELDQRVGGPGRGRDHAPRGRATRSARPAPAADRPAARRRAASARPARARSPIPPRSSRSPAARRRSRARRGARACRGAARAFRAARQRRACPADRRSAAARCGRRARRVASRSSSPTTFSGSRLVSSTTPGCDTGILAARSASATPRPASISTTSSAESDRQRRAAAVVIFVRAGGAERHQRHVRRSSRGSSGTTPAATRSKRQAAQVSTHAPTTIRKSTPSAEQAQAGVAGCVFTRRRRSCCRRRARGRRGASARRARARRARGRGPCAPGRRPSRGASARITSCSMIGPSSRSLGGVVRGRADQLDAALVRLVVGRAADEGRQERVVDVDDAVRVARDELAARAPACSARARRDRSRCSLEQRRARAASCARLVSGVIGKTW